MRAKILAIYNGLVQSALNARLIPRLRFLKRINRTLRSALTPEKVEIDGHVIHLDPIDSLHLVRNREYEPLETDVVRRHVRPGHHILDLGANIGYFTLLCARLVGETGRVTSFEPSPENFELLRKNVAENKYTNTVLMRKGVSDTTETVRLYQPLRSMGHHSLAASDAGEPYVEIETIRLDEFIDDRVDFIKIDVEGAELKAMQGASGILAANRNIVIMTEYNPVALVRFGTPPEDYLRFLRDHGFTFQDIDRNAGAVIPRTIEELSERYNVENGRYTNLLCMRGK